MSKNTHTKGFWRQGRLLITNTTGRWSEEEKEKADRDEKLRVFVDFTFADEGRSRKLIATCQKPEDAERIAICVNALAMLTNEQIAALGKVTPTNP